MLKARRAFYICLQSGVVPYGVGDPGVGKTRTTESFAGYVGRDYECLIGSHHLPEEIAGAPKVVERELPDGKSCLVMANVMPEWRYRLETSTTGGVLHIDELGDCQPDRQAAMLQILGDGIPNTWIGATGNPIEISTNGYELSLPAINRLCQISWPSDMSTWVKGMSQGWEATHGSFPVLPVGWREAHFPLACRMVVGFCHRNPGAFQDTPSSGHAVFPWPSQRSWTNAATVLAAASSIDDRDEEMKRILVSGCVGESAAVELFAWIKALDLPDPEELLASPSSYVANRRADIAFASLHAVVTAALSNNTEERWKSAWEILVRQGRKSPDISAAVCGALVRDRPVTASGKKLRIPKDAKEMFLPLITST